MKTFNIILAIIGFLMLLTGYYLIGKEADIDIELSSLLKFFGGLLFGFGATYFIFNKTRS